MSNIRSTLAGFYSYYGDTLFSELVLPDGIDKETVIEVIMIECGEFQPLFTDGDFFRMAIGTWGKKWNRTFKKWVEALAIEYSPLDNYNRHEEWEDTGEEKGNTKGSNTENTTGDHEYKKAAYDSENYANRDLETVKNETKQEGTTDSTNETKSGHKGHLWGNIGVTTSQQMLRDELDLQEWNLYKHISDLFAEELCLMIY